jgi:hypothetical protein
MALSDKIANIANDVIMGRPDRLNLIHGELTDIDFNLGTVDVIADGLDKTRKIYYSVRYPTTSRGCDMPPPMIGDKVAMLLMGGDEGIPIILNVYRQDYINHKADTDEVITSPRNVLDNNVISTPSIEEGISSSEVAGEVNKSKALIKSPKDLEEARAADGITHVGEIRFAPYGESGPIIHMRSDKVLTLSVPSKESGHTTEVILDSNSNSVIIKSPTIKIEAEELNMKTQPAGMVWNKARTNDALLPKEFGNVQMLLPKGAKTGIALKPMVPFVMGPAVYPGQTLMTWDQLFEEAPLFLDTASRSLIERLKAG